MPVPDTSERIEIERTPSRSGKSRGSFLIDVWQSSRSPEAWHWRLTNGKAAPSMPYPTREAAIEAGRHKDGLGMQEVVADKGYHSDDVLSGLEKSGSAQLRFEAGSWATTLAR